MRAFHLCSGRLPWQIEFDRLIRPTCIFVGSLWLASLTLCAWQGIRRWQSFDQHLRRLNDKVWSCVKAVGSRQFNHWSTRFKTEMRKLAQLRSCAAWPLSSSQYRPSPLCWGHHQQSQRTRTELSRAEQLRDVLVSFGFWMLWGCSCFAVERETLSFLFGRSSALVRKEALSSISSTNLVNFVLRVLFQDDLLPSIGSFGHPELCAPPCVYFAWGPCAKASLASLASLLHLRCAWFTYHMFFTSSSQVLQDELQELHNEWCRYAAPSQSSHLVTKMY